MSVYDRDFDKIIEKALHIIFDKNISIYTFALYYDHETKAVSVCVDTKSNSLAFIKKNKGFVTTEFKKAVSAKDLEKAQRWSSPNERSFSLGDFKLKSLGWEAMSAPRSSKPFFCAMLNSVIRNEKKIAALSSSPETLVFCCSSKDSEVGFSWSYQE